MAALSVVLKFNMKFENKLQLKYHFLIQYMEVSSGPLPGSAMGWPTLVFLPCNNQEGRLSHERFGLGKLTLFAAAESSHSRYPTQ